MARYDLYRFDVDDEVLASEHDDPIEAIRLADEWEDADVRCTAVVLDSWEGERIR